MVARANSCADITAQVKEISDVLDQRALEKVTVLKRVKAKIEAQDEDASS
jgi:vacuolar-type H+-ATPase subunit D/Vma8